MLKWLNENLEEFLMVALLIAMTLIMGIQVFARYALERPYPGPKKSQDICLSGLHLSASAIVQKSVFRLRSSSLLHYSREEDKRFLKLSIIRSS